MKNVLKGFSPPWSGDLEKTTCPAAAREVFTEGRWVFPLACLWVLGKTGRPETFADRFSKYLFLGRIGGQYFWSDLLGEVSRPTVTLGSAGETVRTLQEWLTALGYPLPRYGADGFFGTETRSASVQLQKAERILVDGIVGPQTWGALQNAMARLYTPKSGR